MVDPIFHHLKICLFLSKIQLENYLETIYILLDETSNDELLAAIPLSPELVTPEAEGCSSSELSLSSSSDEPLSISALSS